MKRCVGIIEVTRRPAYSGLCSSCIQVVVKTGLTSLSIPHSTMHELRSNTVWCGYKVYNISLVYCCKISRIHIMRSYLHMYVHMCMCLFVFPRPDWTRCGDYVDGGPEKWKTVSEGQSSDYLMDVLLAEIAKVDISQIRKDDNFQAMVNTYIHMSREGSFLLMY